MLTELKSQKQDILKALCDAAAKDVMNIMDAAFLKSLGSPLMRLGDCWYLWNRYEVGCNCVSNYRCKTENYNCLFRRIKEINLFGTRLKGILLFEEKIIRDK